MCKRAVSKTFTEFALKTQAGKLFNKILIWEMATYASDLVNMITGQRFQLAAVGSYCLVSQYQKEPIFIK